MSTLTDADRLEVVREIWALGYQTGREPMKALYEYERLAKERIRVEETATQPPPPLVHEDLACSCVGGPPHTRAVDGVVAEHYPYCRLNAERRQTSPFPPHAGSPHVVR